MPRLYRSMFHDGERPLIGDEQNHLGVRVVADPRPDVQPDGDGYVGPGQGGMSVAPHWTKLPPFLIPERLNKLVPRARGDNALKCFRHGGGEFADGPVASGLAFRHTSSKHGLVEPAERMTLDSFQAALAATRNNWEVDEN
jgi:hypothetical protein